MSRKKKKQLTRKEQRAQRQAAIARKRREKGWRPPQLNAKQELIDDMLPLFPQIRESRPVSEGELEPMMRVLLDSANLADEPEFEEFILDPFLCVETFINVGEELGIDPEALPDSPDEELEDAQYDLIAQTTRRLLTSDIRREIINRLDQLRLRLKQSAKSKKVAQVAALQLFLSDQKDVESWLTVGLTQALVQRSLEAGFELMSVSMEMMGPEGAEGDAQATSLAQISARPNIAEKIDALTDRIPGLSGFLAKQTDKIWDEGVEAVFDGTLDLDLFTEDELEAAAEVFAEVLGIDQADEDSSQAGDRLELNQSTIPTLISRLGDHLSELFTPDRVDELRDRLNQVAQDASYPEETFAFRQMLAEIMSDEDAIEVEKSFLTWALIGELRISGFLT